MNKTVQGDWWHYMDKQAEAISISLATQAERLPGNFVQGVENHLEQGQRQWWLV